MDYTVQTLQAKSFHRTFPGTDIARLVDHLLQEKDGKLRISPMVKKPTQEMPDTVSSPNSLHSIEPQRILVIRFGRLGDVVLMIPALRALRRHWPQAKIDFIVDHRYEAVPRMCSAVSEVLPLNRLQLRDGNKLTSIMNVFKLAEIIRKRHYDLVLDFHSFRETNLLAWHSRARWRLGLKRVHSPYYSFCFNLPPVPEDDHLHVSEVFLSLLAPFGIQGDLNDCLLELPAESLAEADRFLEQHGISPRSLVVGLNVGAGSEARTWPHEKFAQLGQEILRVHDGYIVLFSGPQEDEIATRIVQRLGSNRVVAALNFPLPKLAATFRRCAVVVSNDTGPMHLAASVGVPTLGLFSVARPEHYRPLGKLSRYIKSTSIGSLEVDEVYAEFERVLALTRVQQSSSPVRGSEMA
ncbi:MAG: glycosyltransferase family 9 protein [Terriglobia bacterium]